MEGGGRAMPAAPEDVMQINEAQASVEVMFPMSDAREFFSAYVCWSFFSGGLTLFLVQK